MAHKVTFAVPERPVGRADIEFNVKKDGGRFGKLRVSKGALVWVPAGKSYGYKLGWGELAELAKTHGKPGHK